MSPGCMDVNSGWPQLASSQISRQNQDSQELI